MPFVLKHKQTDEILSTRLINVYDLPYHGVRSWEMQGEADEGFGDFFAQHPEFTPSDWELFELDESQVKLCNVKLNNDPSRKVYLGENGKPIAK